MGKYIKELTVQNLQTHENTVLEFHPGVNMISGENSAGKSAIFKAIRLLVYNKPSQGVEKELLRKNKSSIVVKAEMNDGSWVLREKGKDVNKYVVFDDIIAKQHGGPLELNSFGTKVPEEVSRILGMPPINLSKKSGGIEINMSAQDEDSFMLSNSSPEIARWIYSFTQLEDVRYVIDDLNKDYRKCGENIKDHDKRIQALNDEIERFDNLEDYEKKTTYLLTQNNNVECQINRICELSQLYNSMVNLREKAKPIIQRIDFLSGKLDVLSDEVMSDIENNIEKVTALSEIYDNIQDSQEQIVKIENRIKELNKINDLQEDNMDEKFIRLQQLIEIENGYNIVVEKEKSTNSKIKDYQKKIKSVDTEIEKVISDLFGDSDNPRCPLCQSEIDANLMGYVIEELQDEKS